VLLNAEDVKQRTAQLKDMTSGDQVAVAWDDLPARLA
jgi:histidyl-tRNA synthetase